MALYRAVLAPRGPLSSPLQSDTLFGAFCWSWLRLYGREALEAELIAPSLAGSPPIVFSNAFPKDTLPLPFGVYDEANRFETVADKGQRRAAYQRGKRLKGARFLNRTGFDAIQRGDWRGFTDHLRKEESAAETVLHNQVDRDSGTVGGQDASGALFGVDRRFYDPHWRFDLYLLTSLEQARFSAALELMLDLGIGADKSTGCGALRLVELQEDTTLLVPPQGANGFVALSNFIPAQDDPVEGWYQTFAKYSKLDREFAAGDTPFKKPLLFLKAGSLFRAAPPRLFYGRCLTGVAAVEAPVTVNACTVAVPVCIP